MIRLEKACLLCWVDEGDVLTSSVNFARVDMSLHLVGRLTGINLTGKTASQMEYEWSEKSDV